MTVSHNYKGVFDMILDKVRGEVGRVENPDWDCSHNYKDVYDMILDKMRVRSGKVTLHITVTTQLWILA